MLQVLAGISLATVLAITGYWLLFTTFMVYDDEGYVLWSLHNFSAHGHLYNEVFTQYGPFFFNYYDVLARILGLTFDNDTSRLITLCHWMGATVLCAAVAWRQTRSYLVMAATAGLTFVYLWIMISEPSHPGGLLTLLVAAGAALGAWAIERERPQAFAIVAGVIGAALALTKINVGALFVFTAVVWMLVNTGNARWGRNAAWLVAVGCLLLPRLLMQSLYTLPWVATFAFLVAAAALPLVFQLYRSRRPEQGIATWGWLVGTGLLAAVVVLGRTYWRGSTLVELMQGILLDPLRHPVVYHVPVQWLPMTRELALGSLAFATLAATRARVSGWITSVVIVLRLGAGLWFFAACTGFTTFTMPKFGFVYGLPLAWIMTMPLHDGPATPAERARLWVAWVFVWQSLHAYPVAGSQINWGTFLWVPVFTVGWHEALCHIAERSPRLRLFSLATGGTILAIAAAVAVGDITQKGFVRYRSSTPLGLPGATRLRPPSDMNSTLRILCNNIRAHGGLLFSLPGLYSFNIWTGKPTPTLANATHWFSLLSAAQQQAIMARLKSDPRACVVVQRFVVDFLHATGFATTGPLYDYLMADFEPVLQLDTYELWVHRGRTIALYGTARLSPGAAGDLRRLELVVSRTDQPVAWIEVRNLFPPSDLLEKNPINAIHPAWLTPIDEAGMPAGPVQSLSEIPPLTRPTRVSVEFPPLPRPMPIAHLLVVLRASDGRAVGELRLVR